MIRTRTIGAGVGVVDGVEEAAAVDVGETV